MPLTKLNNKAVANVTSIPVALGDMVLVSSATASASATIDFSLGNYKEYQFYFVNIRPDTDSINFEFNLSTDNGSNYNIIKTSTAFTALHNEDDALTSLAYDTGRDLAQSTSFQRISISLGNGSDESLSGYLQLFNPSSTTYVKHFISTTNNYENGNRSIQVNVAGYANTTSALTNIKFQMSSGTFSGTILMYGVN